MISELLLFKSSPIARSLLIFRCTVPIFFLFFGTRRKCFSGVACHHRPLFGNVPSEIKYTLIRVLLNECSLKIYVQLLSMFNILCKFAQK